MKAAPSKSELRVQPHRFSEIFLCAKGVGGCACGFQRISEPTQVGIVSLRIVRRFGGDDLFFLTGEFRSQLIGDSFGHLTLDRKDVGQFAIVGIGPKMGIIGCFN